MKPTIKPEWIIYKEGQRIGQGITWHKALDVLIEQERLTSFYVDKMSQYILINSGDFQYRIIKEQ